MRYFEFSKINLFENVSVTVPENDYVKIEKHRKMVSYIYQAIGNLLGEDKPPEELGDPLEFESGLFLDCGISWVYTFKKLILPKELRRTVVGCRCPAQPPKTTINKCRRSQLQCKT